MSEVIHHRVSHHYDDDDDDEEQESIEDTLGEPEAFLDTTFGNVLVVDNLPMVDESKYPKLAGVINKIFSNFGDLAADGLYMPYDDSKVTQGFAFVEYTSKDAAEKALAQLNGYKLDKQHIFKVTRFDDFKKYDEVPDEYRAPKIETFQAKDDLLGWLLDDRTLHGVDQFVVRQGDLTEIYWNDPKAGKPEVVDSASKPSWTETYVLWSPLGTYLSTFHRQGVQLWGGEKWTKQARFAHNGVKLIEFSPNELFVVTFSPQYQENDDPKDPKCIIIWDVRTGAKLRSFSGATNAAGNIVWPAFQWSHDDKYFARIGEDFISVYETPSMVLLDKQSIKIPGVKDFCWSPKQNIISYIVPERDSGNTPAKVVLVEIPSRKELRQKNLFNVTDCKMHWQSGGKYLSVKIDRHTKNKKKTFVNFELFRVFEKDIPIENLELKDPVHAFSWEPKGDRFAVIHGENSAKPDISFYQMAGKKYELLKTLEKKVANHLFWSPRGRFIVLAGLRNLNGALEFFDVNELETMGTDEHMMCTNIDWDPSGRFITTTVSSWHHQLDTGYNLYSFSGKLLYKVLKDRFSQFLWRPRPQNLLSNAQLEEIKTKFPEYQLRYEEEDRLERDRIAALEIEKRQQLRAKFYKLIAERKAERAALRDEYVRVLGRDPKDVAKETQEIEEVVEEVVDEVETILEK
jgi:translation initiation factor 3 subunit B